MVCPVESDAALAKVYLPKGTWYAYFNDTVFEGEKEHLVEVPRDGIPVFVKAGGIIPMQSTVQYAADANDGVLKLHCYAGGDGAYSLYEDDGTTTAYLNGKYSKRQIQLQGTRIEISKNEGDFAPVHKRIRVYLHGFTPKAAVANGLDLKIDIENFRFLPPVSNFDPQIDYPDEAKVISALSSFEFDNHAGPVVIEIS
jgi:alpha-glucosidase